MAANLRDASRRAFTTAGDGASYQEIQTGSVQRIADAVELMAKSYTALISDRDWHKRRAEANEASVLRINRSNIALRGVITRMKRKGRR